jgi:hypothetical protein
MAARHPNKAEVDRRRASEKAGVTDVVAVHIVNENGVDRYRVVTHDSNLLGFPSQQIEWETTDFTEAMVYLMNRITGEETTADQTADEIIAARQPQIRKPITDSRS